MGDSNTKSLEYSLDVEGYGTVYVLIRADSGRILKSKGGISKPFHKIIDELETFVRNTSKPK